MGGKEDANTEEGADKAAEVEIAGSGYVEFSEKRQHSNFIRVAIQKLHKIAK